MNLGELVYKIIAGRAPRKAEGSMVTRALAEAGGVSQLARAIGVQRTTVQRWQKGSQPSQESTELLRSVLRRADLDTARQARLSVSDRLVVKGVQGGGPGKRGRPRTIDLSPYLTPGTMGKAVDAYLRGASPADLHLVVWSGITAQGYRWMFQPPGGVARMAPADRLRATHAAQQGAPWSGGGGGGSGGGSGGRSAGSGDGDDDEDDQDDYEDDGEEYLDDGAWYDGEVADMDPGYEFSASSGSA